MSSPPSHAPGPPTLPTIPPSENLPTSHNLGSGSITQPHHGPQNGQSLPPSRPPPRPTLRQRILRCLKKFANKFSKLFKSLLHTLHFLSTPIVATVIFILVTWITMTGTHRSGPLAHLRPAYGFLVLNLLSKATDYAFEAAVKMTWEEVLWGPLLQRKKSRGRGRGEWLVSFFVLVSEWSAWTRVLAFGWWPRWLGGKDWQRTSHTLGGHPRMWSILRYVKKG